MSSAQGRARMSPMRPWCFEPFRLDPVTSCLWRGDQLLPLPPKPFAVLAYLVAHAGQVVTKDELFEAVWPETVVSEGVLKTCMSQIRQVLGETARMPQYIATVHRRGYRFIAPVTAVEPAPTAPTAVSPFHAPPHMPPQGSQASSLPPVLMVARETELEQLHRRWRHAL